jgi:putative glutamine amidotransferase
MEKLFALEREGLFSPDQFLVLGVYHAADTTDFQPAMDLVRLKNLDWFVFHEIRKPLSPGDLFQENACSPEFRLLSRISDGIIFFGGADIPPYLYGEKTSLLTRIRTPVRSYLEISLIFHLLGGSQDSLWTPAMESNPDLPVLCICLGCQGLNVGTGGSLIQDIWSEIYGRNTIEDVMLLKREHWHLNPESWLYPAENLSSYFFHPIRFSEASIFSREMGFSPEKPVDILSAHHQAVDRTGRDLVVAATSADGKIVEALTHKRYPNVLGIQFHPDYSRLWDRRKTVRLEFKEERLSLRRYMELHPPSLEFNQRIWTWFFEKAVEKHNRRAGD